MRPLLFRVSWAGTPAQRNHLIRDHVAGGASVAKTAVRTICPAARGNRARPERVRKTGCSWATALAQSRGSDHRGNAATLRAARVARERHLHQVLEAAALGKQAGRMVAQICHDFVKMGHGGFPVGESGNSQSGQCT